MPRAKTLLLKGVAERHADAVKLLHNAGDMAIVFRGVVRGMVIRCPDSCGDTITINLDERAGPAWRLFERENRLTLYPSVWRENGCGAHFILWRGRLLWCDRWDDTLGDDGDLRTRVYSLLPSADAAPVHYETLAATLDEIPWDVLWACRALVRTKRAISSAKDTCFRRAPEVAVTPAGADHD
jgi:hypothetical protein